MKTPIDEAGVDGSRISDTALPQHERAPEARARLLADFRAQYEPDPDKLARLVMCKGVPGPSTPSMKWIGVAGGIGARVLLNHFDNKICHAPALLTGPEGLLRKAIEGFAERVVEVGMSAAERRSALGRLVGEEEDDLEHRKKADAHVQAILGGALGPALEGFEDESKAYVYAKSRKWARAESLEDYEALYQAIETCPAAKAFDDDALFAWRRLTGPNPTFLQQTTTLPDRFAVADEHLRAATRDDDSLEAAAAEGRLFLADYAALDRMLESVSEKDGVPMYCYAPLGLFAVPRGGGSLRAVAIQTGQDPSQSPIVCPGQGVDWRVAKTVYEVADMCFYEPITHLALTHLMIEPVALATRRTLAPNHPISRLLIPHFEGTISVNDNAVRYLLADRGSIDQTFGATIASIRGAAVEAISHHEFRSDTLPTRLEASGLADRSLMPDNPHRDDALRIWGAISRWVSGYVQRAYVDEAAFRGDPEIASWAAALGMPVSDGGLNGFGSVGSRADMIEILTKIIYTASAGHAAVNYPQWTDSGFAPRMSGAGYTPVPVSPASHADWMAMLPPLEKAELHCEVLYLLGTLYHTQLGRYESIDQPHDGVFTDPVVVNELLPAFQRDLEAIEAHIDVENASGRRAWAYTHLKPSKIPQSINV